jgi:Rieske Fe-S protein
MEHERCWAAKLGSKADVDRKRRQTVGLLMAGGLAAILPAHKVDAADAAKERPQPGDELVHAAGERKGQPVAPADVQGKAVGAWAKEPSSGTVRSGSRLNRVLLVRIDPEGVDGKTKKRVAEGGIVAYSAFCTHAGCAIENFKPEEQLIVCHCHSSVFDPRANGKVVSGPAKRSLAGLPVKVEGDRLVVAGEFEGKVGVPKPGA